MAFFSKKHTAGQVDFDHLPRHVAIIMDGNGRWAQKRNLPRTAGHKAGAENFRQIATYCKNIGIQYLTVYAFSTENWKRPPAEISAIMSLLKTYLLESIQTMEKDQIRLRFLGDLSALPEELQQLAQETNEITQHIHGFQANVCLNYGGRDEILRAAKALAYECREGRLSPEQITMEDFEQHLYSHGLPDPDLIIRPSGELRLSNFLLWQCAYSEFYFCDTLWPDFHVHDMEKALLSYQKRNRRYGGVK